MKVYNCKGVKLVALEPILIHLKENPYALAWQIEKMLKKLILEGYMKEEEYNKANEDIEKVMR